MGFTAFKGLHDMNFANHPSSRFLAKVGLLTFLSACGGGGGGGGGGDAPSAALSGSAVPTAATAPSAASGTSTPPLSAAETPAAPAPTLSATCGLADFAATALARINQLRAAGASCGARGSFAPTGALAWSTPLTQASQGHSQDMATVNYFSHTSADGRTLADRVNATGYAWSTIGENIAAGYATMDGVMDGWVASDGHCANLMNPNFTQVGLACIPGAAGSTYNTYWTMDLGRPL